jgi:hypothetical protein
MRCCNASSSDPECRCRRRIKWAATAIWLAKSAAMAGAATWAAGSSDWNSAANWSPAAVPGSNAMVNITDTDGVSRTITYDYPGPAVTLGSLTLNLTGGTAGAANTISISANTLSASGETIGSSGSGAITQNGGGNAINGPLVLGDNAGSIGTYTLSGTGSLADTSVGESVGYFGSGVFNQSGGSNTATQLEIAEYSGSSGTYNLSGTASLTTKGGLETIGAGGGGSFDQSGGTNTVSAGSLLIGGNSNSTGSYTLSGGILDASGGQTVEDVYNDGSFIQTGGTNTVNLSNDGGGLNLGGGSGATPASYTLSGGSLTTGSVELQYQATLTVSGTGSLTVLGLLDFNGGKFIQTGGSATIAANFPSGDSPQLDLTGGKLAISNHSSSVNGTIQYPFQFTGGDFILGPAATLDITNNSLELNYPSGPLPIAALQAAAASGYNHGAWNGTGIVSSYVAANNAAGPVYGVAVVDGADYSVQNNAIQLAPNDILITPALLGDADLNGTVDFNDFSLLSAHFSQAGDWADGNFDYGPTIDFQDFELLAGNFSKDSSLTSGELNTMQQFAGDSGYRLVANSDGVGFEVVQLPEPGTAGLALLGAGLLSRRRFRKQNV